MVLAAAIPRNGKAAATRLLLDKRKYTRILGASILLIFGKFLELLTLTAL